MKIGAFLKARLEHTLNARRSRTGIAALQLRKFRRIVAHANARSPYYRDLIAARGIDIANCVPSDFPPLTKPILMANFDRIVTDPRITAAGIEDFLLKSRDPRDLFLDKYTVIHSSGSSGTIGYFVRSPSEQARTMALVMRTLPFALRRRRIAFFGLIGGHYGGATGIAGSRRGLAKLRFESKAFDLSAPFPQVVEQLNAFQPHILSAYPTAMRQLAEAQASGTLRIAPTLLSMGGEPLTPEDQSFFDQVFDAKISNHYGTSEHSIMGYGLSEDRGMYLFEDELIFEIEAERVLVTNLFNYTQPLIRNAIDDRLEPQTEVNGRLPFTKIKNIQGRAWPSPVFTNQHGQDDTLSAFHFVEFFVPNVERIELVVFDKQSCLLRFKLKDGLLEPQRLEARRRVERRLTDIFQDKDMGSISRRVEEVQQFDSWKPRLITLPPVIEPKQ